MVQNKTYSKIENISDLSHEGTKKDQNTRKTMVAAAMVAKVAIAANKKQLIAKVTSAQNQA